MAGGIKLQWRDRNYAEDSHRIYRSDTPMILSAMPTPIATITNNVTEYIDYDVIQGNTYYYRIGAVRGNDELELIAEEPSYGPGSQDLIGGDMTAGFFGEVSSSEFITGDQLATSLNITEGVSINTNTLWLKFALEDEIIFIPKKTIRHSISWEAIYQAGAVYGTNDNGLYPSGGDRLQDAMVSIGDDSFKVTLIKGGNTDPVASNTTGYDIDWTHQSEWNRLMYPIHSGIHTNPSNPSNPSVPYAQWASYSDEDLLLHQNFGAGSFSIGQEQHPGVSGNRVRRGGAGVTLSEKALTTYTNASTGFRPALRLVR